MDTFADAASRQEQNGAPEDVERRLLSFARRTIEEIKAGLRNDPGLFNRIHLLARRLKEPR
jgi:hypothetical protein